MARILASQGSVALGIRRPTPTTLRVPQKPKVTMYEYLVCVGVLTTIAVKKTTGFL